MTGALSPIGPTLAALVAKLPLPGATPEPAARPLRKRLAQHRSRTAMTRMLTREEALATNARVAQLVFDLSTFIALTERCSGPNAVCLILGGVAQIMVQNERQSAARLLHSYADLLEHEYSPEREKAVNLAQIDYLLANEPDPGAPHV